MKQTFSTMVSVTILMIMLSLSLAGCKEKRQNEISGQLAAVETVDVEISETTEQQISSESTVLENTESIRETWEVEVLESTPNKITSEATNQKGETIKTSLGVEKSDETVPDEEDDAGNAPPQTDYKPIESKPTEPKPTEAVPNEPEYTEPKDYEPEPTQEIPTGIKVEEPGADITYSDYQAMSEEEQILFYYSFADSDAFNSWYAAAKKAYDAGRTEIVIGTDGVVNLG